MMFIVVVVVVVVVVIIIVIVELIRRIPVPLQYSFCTETFLINFPRIYLNQNLFDHFSQWMCKDSTKHSVHFASYQTMYVLYHER